jgi:hypothetical protein
MSRAPAPSVVDASGGSPGTHWLAYDPALESYRSPEWQFADGYAQKSVSSHTPPGWALHCESLPQLNEPDDDPHPATNTKGARIHSARKEAMLGWYTTRATVERSVFDAARLIRQRLAAGGDRCSGGAVDSER